MSRSADDLRIPVPQEDPLVEVQRRLQIRDRLDQNHRMTQRVEGRDRLERRTQFSSSPTAIVARPVPASRRLPLSGNAALWASAVIQGTLGVEFTLSGLNKLADPRYLSDFDAFVRSNPGAGSGPLSSLVQALVLPHVGFFAAMIQITELVAGLLLLIGAVGIGRRRFAGRIGRQHRYEAVVALSSAGAGVTAAGLTLSIALLMGEGFPMINAGRAFTTAIPIELLIVPLGLAIAWLELGRFRVLVRGS